MISISKGKGFDPRHHKYFTAAGDGKGVDWFCKVLTKNVWSPCVWQGGVRERKNFLSCSYLALDFDDGRWTIAITEQWLADNKYIGIIGTSKSHQIEKTTPSGKVSPPVDRFRLIVPFAETITDKKLYEFNMRKVMEDIPVDPSCKDAARFFFPCKKIVAVTSGGLFPCVNDLKDPEYSQSLVVEKSQNKRMETSGTALIPGWILGCVKHGQGEGGRHKLCYRIGAQMSRCGFDTEFIINYVSLGPLSEIGAGDVRRAVENGARAAGEEK